MYQQNNDQSNREERTKKQLGLKSSVMSSETKQLLLELHNQFEKGNKAG